MKQLMRLLAYALVLAMMAAIPSTATENKEEIVYHPDDYPFEFRFSEEQYNVFFRNALDVTPRSLERSRMKEEYLTALFDSSPGLLGFTIPGEHDLSTSEIWANIYIYPYSSKIDREQFRHLLEDNDPSLSEFRSNMGLEDLEGIDFYEHADIFYLYEKEHMNLMDVTFFETYTTVWDNYVIRITTIGPLTSNESLFIDDIIDIGRFLVDSIYPASGGGSGSSGNDMHSV